MIFPLAVTLAGPRSIIARKIGTIIEQTISSPFCQCPSLFTNEELSGMPKPRTKHKKQTGAANKPPIRSPRASRPFSLRRLIRGSLITLAILAVPVTWLILEEREARALADLSVIGSGEDEAVQVFDQNCPQCRRLGDNAGQALSNLEHPPAWREVNINTSHGRQFAGDHGVSHITIVLFDGNGQRANVIEGVTGVGELEEAFLDVSPRTLQRIEQ